MFTLWTGVTQYLLELETKAHWGISLDISTVCFQTSCISSELRDRRGSSAVAAVAVVAVVAAVAMLTVA